MLAKIVKQNHDNKYDPDTIYAVMCIVKTEQSVEYYLYDYHAFSMPYLYREDEVMIIEATIPAGWVTVTSDDGLSVTSYKEWAEQGDLYYHYLAENSYYKKESPDAYAALSHNYQQLIDFYTEKYFGDIDKIRSLLMSENLQKDQSLNASRGWEIPEISQDTYKIVHLRDIVRLAKL